MKNVNLSLRSKLIGLVLLVVTLLGVGSYFNLSQFEKDYRAQVSKQFTTTAMQLSDAITAQLYERYGDVQAFALNRSVISLNKDLITIDLDQYVTLYGIYDLIVVVDKNGKLVASNTKDVGGKPVNEANLAQLDYKKFGWFNDALNGKFTEDKTNKYTGTVIEDFVYDSLAQTAFNEERYGTSFSAPIKDSHGNIVGVVSNRAGSRWYQSEVASFHNKLVGNNFTESEIYVINADNFVVTHSDVNTNDKMTHLTNDSKIILAKKISDSYPDSIAKIENEKTGFFVSHSVKSKTEDFIAFHTVDGGKSIASLGWKVVIDNTFVNTFQNAFHAKKQSLIVLSICSFFGLLIALWFGIIISKSISKITETLAQNSVEVSDAAVKIASGSTELSEAATEQAAALQETVAAVDQISAMVEKNSEAAQKSRQVSQQSSESAAKGREIVANMIAAIQDIDHSNDEVSQQMDDSNRQLSEITKLINDISNKTKVINEIVFQTKLLSFNASVEAARAGEYGKGFAVVAEEVGNLAQMSGNAAKEISTLLEESVQKVNSIVSDTKTRVDRLMAASKEKVSNGSRTAHDCNNALEEILSQVQTVDSLVSEIAVASQEQSTGVREVSKAIGQMEQVTQQNSSVAQASSVAAEDLSGQSIALNHLIKQLSYIVHGHGESNLDTSSQINQSRKTFSSTAFKASAKPGQVLKFKSGSKKEESQEFEAEKKVAGSDFTPSNNDPGFNE